MVKHTPLLLVIMDGFGVAAPAPDNAVTNAAMPNWRGLLAQYPVTLLHASEQYVGLPKGQMGNSEVGHMNIGGGRQVLQELPRINESIKADDWDKKPQFQNFVARIGGVAHVIGMLSRGGVHGHIDHVVYAAKKLVQSGKKVAVHFITDGRDTAPQSALANWVNVKAAWKKELQSGAIKIATITGRYYAMDRDNNWNRTEQAFQAMVHGVDNKAKLPSRSKETFTGKNSPDLIEPISRTIEQAINHAYANNLTDEFLLPTVLTDNDDIYYQGMRAEDGVLFCNFRADRMRQLASSMVMPNFTQFKRSRAGAILTLPQVFLGMTPYETELNKKLPILFDKQEMVDTCGQVLANHGLRQLRIAETEKYAHVTFFFNGGRELPYAKEDRILIPSPKVATYDLKPEMSAHAVCAQVVQSLENNQHDVIILNFANADMVGHSGLLQPSIKALETLDLCLGQLYHSIKKQNGAMVVTADHGNIESLYDKTTKQPNTAHTLNPVPFLVMAHGVTHKNLLGAESLQPTNPNQNRNADVMQLLTKLPVVGALCDIAPTLLWLLGLPQPKAMTGQSLLT